MKTIGRTDEGDILVSMTKEEQQAFNRLAQAIGNSEPENFSSSWASFQMSSGYVVDALTAIATFAYEYKSLIALSEDIKQVADSLLKLREKSDG